MMNRPIVLLGLLGCLTGCAAPVPPPEHLGRTLAVLPVNNRTGDPLLVSGDGLLDRHVFHTEIASVSDVLEAEAVFQLREKGFLIAAPLSDTKSLRGRVPKDPADAATVAAQAGLGPLCLYLEIRRWEAEGRAHVNVVSVDLEASLIDTKSGQLLWKGGRRGPIATPGEFLVEAAYVSAARKVTAEILASLHPDPSAPY